MKKDKEAPAGEGEKPQKPREERAPGKERLITDGGISQYHVTHCLCCNIPAKIYISRL